MLEISWPKLLFLSTFFNNFLRFSQFLTSSCFFPGVGGLRFWDATLLFARGWLAWWSPYRTQDDPMQRLGPLRWYQVGGCLPCQLFQALGREGLEPMGRSRASGIPLLKRLLNMDCPMKKRREGCAFCLPFSWKSRNPHKLRPYVFQHSLQVGGFHKFSPTALRPSSKTSCGLIWKWYTPKSNDWLSCSPIKVYQSIWTLHFGGGDFGSCFLIFSYLPTSLCQTVGDAVAWAMAKEKAIKVSQLLLAWLLSAEHQPVPSMRLDFMVKRLGPGKARVIFGEYCEQGACVLGWQGGPPTIWRACLDAALRGWTSHPATEQKGAEVLKIWIWMAGEMALVWFQHCQVIIPVALPHSGLYDWSLRWREAGPSVCWMWQVDEFAAAPGITRVKYSWILMCCHDAGSILWLWQSLKPWIFGQQPSTVMVN